MLPPNAVRRWFEFSATGASTVKPFSSLAITRKPIARVIGICSCRNFSASRSMTLLRRFLQQPLEFALPQSGNRVTPVAAGLVAEWNYHRTSLRYPLDFAFENPELRRVD